MYILFFQIKANKKAIEDSAKFNYDLVVTLLVDCFSKGKQSLILAQCIFHIVHKFNIIVIYAHNLNKHDSSSLQYTEFSQPLPLLLMLILIKFESKHEK